MNNEVLQEIFTKQAELNKRVGKDHNNLNDQQLVQWVKDYGTELMLEYAELLEHLPRKWWKDYSDKPIDYHQCKIELVDMMHFFVSMILPFMTAEEFVDLYFKKLGLNHTRQDLNYNDEYEQKFKQPGKEDNDLLKNNLPEVRCPECYGRGYTYGYDKNAENETCKVCNGRGKITTAKHNEICKPKITDKYHVDCKRCGGTGVITKVVGAQQTKGYPPVIGCHTETETCPDCLGKRLEMIGQKLRDEGRLPLKSTQVCQICHGRGFVQDSDCNCNIKCGACGGNGYV